jgi:hypothetical protein
VDWLARFHSIPFLVIVSDLDPGYTIFAPTKDDPPLVIDPNRVEASSVAPERLQPIARWHRKIVKPRGGIQILQLPLGRALEVGREPPCRARHPIVKQVLSQPIPEGPDHN